jgi:hypothetical protein
LQLELKIDAWFIYTAIAAVRDRPVTLRHEAYADKRIALVIGNSAYQENPANDANAVATSLPFMARNRHADCNARCPLSGAKRKTYTQPTVACSIRITMRSLSMSDTFSATTSETRKPAP